MHKYSRSLLLGLLLLIPLEGVQAETKRKKRKREHKASGLQRHTGGVGIALGAGTHSGITGILPLRKNTYLQSTLGVIGFLQNSLAIDADYISEFPGLLETPTVVPYAGGGVTFLMGDDFKSLVNENDGNFHLGARFPFGMYMLLDDMPVQLYGEIVPGLLIVSAINPILSISLGFRWML